MTDVKQVIAVRKDLKMKVGKLSSQIAHAAMMFLLEGNESDRPDTLLVLLSNDEAEWCSGSFTKAVAAVSSEQELRDLIVKAKMLGIEAHEVVDEGRTAFNGVPTLTCAAFGPCKAAILDEVTGHLPLL